MNMNKEKQTYTPRDSLFKAVTDPWAATTCSQTRKIYAFKEQEGKLIQTNKNRLWLINELTQHAPEQENVMLSMNRST